MSDFGFKIVDMDSKATECLGCKSLFIGEPIMLKDKQRVAEGVGVVYWVYNERDLKECQKPNTE